MVSKNWKQGARGARIELGEYADTQSKPEIGPFAAARTR
jgi:hypothetical protein